MVYSTHAVDDHSDSSLILRCRFAFCYEHSISFPAFVLFAFRRYDQRSIAWPPSFDDCGCSQRCSQAARLASFATRRSRSRRPGHAEHAESSWEVEKGL